MGTASGWIHLVPSSGFYSCGPVHREGRESESSVWAARQGKASKSKRRFHASINQPRGQELMCTHSSTVRTRAWAGRLTSTHPPKHDEVSPRSLDTNETEISMYVRQG